MRTSTVALPALVLTLLSCAATTRLARDPRDDRAGRAPGTLEPPRTVATVAPATTIPGRRAAPTTAPRHAGADDVRYDIAASSATTDLPVGGRRVLAVHGRHRTPNVLVPDVWPDRSTAPGSLADGAPAPLRRRIAELTLFLDSYETAASPSSCSRPRRTTMRPRGLRLRRRLRRGESTPFATEAWWGVRGVDGRAETGTDIVVIGARRPTPVRRSRRCCS